MKNLIFAAAFCLALLCFAGAAPAANSRFMVLGVGASSCGVWTADRQGHDVWSKAKAFTDEAWVEGFLTGYNNYGSGSNNVSSATDPDGVFAYIDNWCRQHPLRDIATASEALILKLEYRHR